MKGITSEQLAALRLLVPALEAGTYLAGGVAIATMLGHRTSNDLDLFVPHEFDAERLEEQVAAVVPEVKIVGRARGTLHLEVQAIPVSVLSYRYPSIAPPTTDDALPIPRASLEDLACMKIAAISGRGAAKDFWDLDELLGHGFAGGSLASALSLYQRKYPAVDIGHAVRSLAYFGDADAAPLPAGLSTKHWTTIKRRFADRVREL